MLDFWRTLIGNHRTVFALMNSFLAEHFGHSLSLSFPSFLSLRLSSINKRGGRRYCRILPFVITRQNKKMEKADGGIKGGKKRGAKKNGGKMITPDQSWAAWEAAIRYRNARNSRRKYREKRLFCRGSPLYAAAREDGETRARFP